MRKAIQTMLQSHASTSNDDFIIPSKQVLDLVIESSNGDIRSAIMGLQFACLVQGPKKKRGGADSGTVVVTEAVTRREQSLALFHLIGKVLYNKRKPISSSPGMTYLNPLVRQRRSCQFISLSEGYSKGKGA